MHFDNFNPHSLFFVQLKMHNHCLKTVLKKLIDQQAVSQGVNRNFSESISTNLPF